MNAFFVSHFGQLGQAQSLIDFENLKNNNLYIIYTDANKKVPELIKNKASKHLFSKIELVKIPRNPNNIDIKKLISIYKIYNSVLSSFGCNNVYLMSFEFHYALIGNLAKEKKLKIFLIEEGTATYKFNELGENIAPVKSSKSYKSRIHSFLIKNFPTYKKIRPALNYWKEFDCIYAAFPKKLCGSFDFKRSELFFMHMVGGLKVDIGTINLVKKYNINSDDYIYVNQRYSVSDSSFANVIIDIIKKVIIEDDGVIGGQSRVFVKFHPKDGEGIRREFKKEIDKNSCGDWIIIIDEPTFLIEPIIKIAKPKGIIGIASTALVYTPLLSSETRVMCIGDCFIKYLDLSNAIDKETKNTILSHIEIVKKFDNIWIASQDSDSHISFESLTKNSSALTGVLPSKENLDILNYGADKINIFNKNQFDLNIKNEYSDSFLEKHEDLFFQANNFLIKNEFERVDEILQGLSFDSLMRFDWLLFYARYNYLINKVNKSKFFYTVIENNYNNLLRLNSSFHAECLLMTANFDWDVANKILSSNIESQIIMSVVLEKFMSLCEKTFDMGELALFKDLFLSKENEFNRASVEIRERYFALKIKFLFVFSDWEAIESIVDKNFESLRSEHWLWIAHAFLCANKFDQHVKASHAYITSGPKGGEGVEIIKLWNEILCKNINYHIINSNGGLDLLAAGEKLDNKDYKILLKHAECLLERGGDRYKKSIVALEKLSKNHPVTRFESALFFTDNCQWSTVIDLLSPMLTNSTAIPGEISCIYLYALLSKNKDYEILQGANPKFITNFSDLIYHKKNWLMFLEVCGRFLSSPNKVRLLTAAYFVGDKKTIEVYRDAGDLKFPESEDEFVAMSSIYIFWGNHQMALKCYEAFLLMVDLHKRDEVLNKIIMLRKLA